MCGTKNEEGVNFCSVCGHKFQTENSSSKRPLDVPIDSNADGSFQSASPDIHSKTEIENHAEWNSSPNNKENYSNDRQVKDSPNLDPQSSTYSNNQWSNQSQQGSWNNQSQQGNWNNQSNSQWNNTPAQFSDKQTYPSPNQNYANPYQQGTSKIKVGNSQLSAIIILNMIIAVFGVLIFGFLFIAFRTFNYLLFSAISILLLFGSRMLSKSDNRGRYIVGSIQVLILIASLPSFFIPGIFIGFYSLYVLFAHKQTVDEFSVH